MPQYFVHGCIVHPRGSGARGSLRTVQRLSRSSEALVETWHKVHSGSTFCGAADPRQYLGIALVRGVLRQCPSREPGSPGNALALCAKQQHPSWELRDPDSALELHWHFVGTAMSIPFSPDPGILCEAAPPFLRAPNPDTAPEALWALYARGHRPS